MRTELNPLSSMLNADYPVVNFPYLNSNIPESPAYGVFVSTVDTLSSGLFKILKIFCSEDLFWFQSYWSRDSLHGNYFSEIIWSSYRHCSQIWRFCVTYVEGFVHQLWHMTGFQLFLVNRDGCHMWGRKCSLFPEHLISLPLGRFMISPNHYIYTLHNLSV